MTEDASRKRPRTDSDAAEIKRTETGLWYEDGNVVLVAENTAFKVHRSLLGQSSDVFRDMFELAQPDVSVENPDMYEGLPVVRLTDTRSDLECFLKILFMPGQDPYFRTDRMAYMPWVATLLKLGLKYQVKFVTDEAIKRLKLECPRLHTEHLLYLQRRNRRKSYIRDPGGNNDTIGIPIVHLARTFNLPYLLPWALYLCCQLPPDTLVHGVSYPDGSTYKLSPDDLARCIRGGIELRQTSFALACSWASIKDPGGCTFNEELTLEDDFQTWFNNADILRKKVTDYDPAIWQDPDRCPSCEARVNVTFESLQRLTFERLPATFSL